MIGNLGTTEILLLFIAAIALFGATKVSKAIPELAHSLGSAVGYFKKGKKEMDIEISELTADTESVKEDLKTMA